MEGKVLVFIWVELATAGHFKQVPVLNPAAGDRMQRSEQLEARVWDKVQQFAVGKWEVDEEGAEFLAWFWRVQIEVVGLHHGTWGTEKELHSP